MPRLIPAPRFVKRLRVIAEREPARAQRINAVLRRFAADPRHPGLHFEKLGGSAYRSIRISLGERLIVRQIETDAFELVDVGEHDRMYHRYG
jgi:mRNA-degrading endonuclease YafQ of YafQ-DinJ toxin-antitoxin module